MSLPLVFSLIFFIAFAVYFFTGLYVLSLNVYSKLHRIFFANCISLCFWAFSFSIANAAPDYETCLLWRRVASLGWGTCFSILLHFILILTNRNKLLQKKWLYLLLYFPALANIFAFGLYSETAVKLYHLIYTEAGWVNIPGNTVWNVWYNFYYLFFSAIGAGLALQWGISSKDRLVRKQIIMMGTAYAFAIIAGTLSEFVVTSLFPRTSLQIGPIISLMPMLTILYCIKRYHFLTPDNKSQKAEAGQILSEASRNKLYWYLLLSYIAGAFIYFSSQYFGEHESMRESLKFSVIMLILGFMLKAIQHMKIKIANSNIISEVFMAVTIPILMIKYLDASAVYALTVPVIFILISVAFNQSRMLIMTGVITLTMLLLIWMEFPSQAVSFDFSDHLTRIVIFLMMWSIAYYIHRIYCGRLVQYENQVKQQELIAAISADFVSSNEDSIDSKINNMLKRCCEYFQADQAYIIFFDDMMREVNLLYEWRNPGMISVSEFIEDLGEEDLPEWLDRSSLIKHGNIHILAVDELENGFGRKFLEEQQIQSVLTTLLMEKNDIFGFFVIHSLSDEKIRDSSAFKTVQMIGNLVTHTLLKVSAERELNHLAYFDYLTDIPNRMFFKKRLSEILQLAEKSNKMVGLIYLDLDLFKTVNDIMGHDIGDIFLKQVAANLSACLKDGDVLARFGGDEFLICISHAADLDDILDVANRILDMFCTPICTERQEFSVTASMGISVFPTDGSCPEELVKHADLAMYCSKECGKNRYTVCSDGLKKEFRLKTELTNSLYHALEKNEMELYYQPKVKSDGRIVGVEALVRWNHPTLGLILPDKFIAIAESIGLIAAIDEWVVRKACWQSKVWHDRGFLQLKIAFNLSPAQFYRESFINSIESAIKENGLDPKFLEVEITESLAYYRQETFLKTVRKLKDIGLSIAIDDFGSDYSSLSRLRSLPIDRIKIDKRFTDEIPYDKKQRDIVKAILALGNILGLKVTVEGVENRQQLEFFKENICDEIQGYYFYKPMPAKELESILKQ